MLKKLDIAIGKCQKPFYYILVGVCTVYIDFRVSDDLPTHSTLLKLAKYHRNGSTSYSLKWRIINGFGFISLHNKSYIMHGIISQR